MTTHESTLRALQQNNVTAVVGGNYGQNVVIPLLWNRAYPSQKVLVVVRKIQNAELLREVFKELSSKYHRGSYTASTKLESNTNTVYQSSFKIYNILLENKIEDLKKFSLIFIDEISSGSIETDLIFGLFLNKLGSKFKGKIVLNGRTVNYPYKQIYYHRMNDVDFEKSQNPFISYYTRSYNPINGLNRRMFTDFANYIIDKLNFNIINDKIVGNIVVFLPGAGEIKFVKDLLQGKTNEMKVIEITGKNLSNFSSLYQPRGMVILTTNVIHSILGIPNVRLVFDSMQEKTPVTMSSGVSVIQTTRITKQEANTRAMLAYKKDSSSFSYVFRFTTEKNYQLLSETKKERYSKESFYSQVLDFYRTNVPIKILASIADTKTIDFAVKNLQKYDYLEGKNVVLNYTQTFGIVIERIYSNFLAEKSLLEFTNEKMESYHFCFICICVIVSEFRRGYFNFPRGMNEKETGKYFLTNYQKFEGKNELLTYLNIFISKYYFLKDTYKNMKQNIDIFCRDNLLNTEEIKRAFVKIKQITDSENIYFKPTVLSENDYIQVSRSFANYYYTYKPESVLEKKNGKYVYQKNTNKYVYIHDKFYTGVSLEQRNVSPKIIILNGKTIEKRGFSNIDGYIRFYVPFTDDYAVEKTIELILLPDPLVNFNTDNLKLVSWGRIINTQLPDIYNDPFSFDRKMNSMFSNERIIPVYSSSKEKIIKKWEKVKYYPLHKESTNILEYDVYFSTYNMEEYKSNKFNTYFYSETLMEQVYVTINTRNEIDRIHFDLAQDEIVVLEPINDISPDEKWMNDKTNLIEKSIVQSDTGYRLDQKLLEENIKPFFSYPTITALTGLINYLFNTGDKIQIFEKSPFLGELLFCTLRKNIRSYQTSTLVKEWKELYFDIIHKTVGWIPRKNESVGDVLYDRTNGRFQVTKKPDPSNLFLMRSLKDQKKTFFRDFDKYIDSAAGWVVLWIQDPRDYVAINQKISKYSFLSYYGVIRFNETQFFWVYSVIEENEEAFGFE